MTGLLNSSSYCIPIVRIGKSSVIKGPAGTISSKSLSFEPRFKATSGLVSLLECHLTPPCSIPPLCKRRTPAIGDHPTEGRAMSTLRVEQSEKENSISTCFSDSCSWRCLKFGQQSNCARFLRSEDIHWLVVTNKGKGRGGGIRGRGKDTSRGPARKVVKN